MEDEGVAQFRELPSYDECSSVGSTGTPLQRFIWNNEPAKNSEAQKFRDDLREVLTDVTHYAKQDVENASLRAELATMTAFAKTQQQLAADLENTLVKENAALLEARSEVARLQSQLRAKDIVAGKLAEQLTQHQQELHDTYNREIAAEEQVVRLEKERDEANEVCKHAVAEMVDAIAELNGFRALNEHLPPGFDIGDDATAELAIKLVAAEARIRELQEKK